MAPVELSRLKPQISALMLQHEDCDRFMRYLVALMEDNRDKTKPHFLRRISLLPTFNIPKIVKSELESAFIEFAKQEGDSTLPIADALWDFNSYETKILAITILASIESQDHHQLVERLAMWIDPKTDPVLVSELLSHSIKNLRILENDALYNLIAHWLGSKEKEIKRTGLKSIILVIASKGFTNLPRIFQLLDPVIEQPDVQVQGDLLSLIRKLIDYSQAETASFLFSRYQLTQNKNTTIFIRKCIQNLDAYYQDEFKNRFQ